MKNKVINLFGDKKVVSNTGVKYSKLLEQFIEPFATKFTDTKYIEDIFEFAINAWNMANMIGVMPIEEAEKAMNSIQEEKDVDVSLLKKMIAHKQEKFKEFTSFILDFELEQAQAGKDPILRVVTQESETYLSNTMNALDEEFPEGEFLPGDEFLEDNFDENFIDRSAIILKPQQPFIDWCSNLNSEDSHREDSNETNIYLIDEEIDDVEKWLKKKFDIFFMMQLEDWCINKKLWPLNRNYKMFKLWFNIDTSGMIYDLEKKPILKSE